MKRTVSLVACLLVGLVFCSRTSFADQLENGKNDRKGFFIGFGLGGGALNLRAAGTSETKGAFISDLKIGGGITEDILLMYDGSYQYTKINGVTFQVTTTPVAVQWYPIKNWYIRPGVGFSYVKASANVAGVNISATSDVSYAFDFASGYDFRFGKYFALSPEFVYHYDHVRSDLSNGHINSFGAQASCVWFF
jgi:hypothetical protein